MKGIRQSCFHFRTDQAHDIDVSYVHAIESAKTLEHDAQRRFERHGRKALHNVCRAQLRCTHQAYNPPAWRLARLHQHIHTCDVPVDQTERLDRLTDLRQIVAPHHNIESLVSVPHPARALPHTNMSPTLRPPGTPGQRMKRLGSLVPPD